MRTLAMALACLVATAAARPTLVEAGAAADTSLQVTRNGLTLETPELRAEFRGTGAAGIETAEVDLASGALQAHLFRNAEVSENFTGSRLRFGKTVRSPYLARLGVGDGVSARGRPGGYSLTGAVISGPAGDSVAGEVTAFDGAVALQAGYRGRGAQAGPTSFAGAHVDFDILNAGVSLRWHAGQEDDPDGTRRSSAGGVVVGLRSVLEDGDRLRAAMSRPVGPAFGIAAPDLAFSYMMPARVGRLTCAGGLETRARSSMVRVSWGLTW